MSEATDVTLAQLCIGLCQTLKGKGITFSLNLKATNFLFSLDTSESAEKVLPVVRKKKTSPSQRRRNARRREEFLARKNPVHPTKTSISSNDDLDDQIPQLDGSCPSPPLPSTPPCKCEKWKRDGNEICTISVARTVWCQQLIRKRNTRIYGHMDRQLFSKG